MLPIRSTLAALAVLACAAVPGAGPGEAQTKIRIGKIISGSGFHIPSYVALDRGFYKAEGLDATLIVLAGKAQVTAGMSGAIDFTPIVSGGAQASLAGAELRYVVGQALKSHWLFVSKPTLAKPEDLKGKTLGFGRAGSADYDEGAAVLLRFFKMSPGKDYKVISLQSEADRIAALINGSIDAGLITIPHAPSALNAGMKVLTRIGDYMPRAGGAFWTSKSFADKNPEVIPRFIRAIAKAVMYYRDNKAGSIQILKDHLGIASDKDAAIVWEQTHATYGAELPRELYREIFEARRQAMIADGQWAKDKPLPDPEQWLMRDVLEKTLADMKYVPTKL